MGSVSAPVKSNLLVVMCESTSQVEGAARERGVPGAAEVEALWGWVESHLFTNSLERKYLAFHIFQLMLPFLRCALSLAWPYSKLLPMCFSPNIENLLHRAQSAPRQVLSLRLQRPTICIYRLQLEERDYGVQLCSSFH